MLFSFLKISLALLVSTTSALQAGSEAPNFPGMVKIAPGVVQYLQPMRISNEFWILDHEITQKEYLSLMASTPSTFTTYVDCPGNYFEDVARGFRYCPNRPVETISARDANTFIFKLNQLSQERDEPWVYSLPSFAEWLLATGPINKQEAARQGCYGNTSTRDIKSHQPNQNKLYDMLGNVGEFLLDRVPPELIAPGDTLDDPVFVPPVYQEPEPYEDPGRPSGAPGSAYRLRRGRPFMMPLKVVTNFNYNYCFPENSTLWLDLLKTLDIGERSGQPLYSYESERVGFRVIARKKTTQEPK